MQKISNICGRASSAGAIVINLSLHDVNVHSISVKTSTHSHDHVSRPATGRRCGHQPRRRWPQARPQSYQRQKPAANTCVYPP